MKIVIRGNSVGALACAHLLKNAGLNPVLERTGRPRLPAIMLSDAALKLMRDVFGRPQLFRHAPRINRRVVKWGAAAEPHALEHSALVISEQELLAELEQGIAIASSPELIPEFTIFASRPLPAGPQENIFGSRIASAVKVQLKDARDAATCWIESLDDGWLFLIPNAADSGWLLSVGGSADLLSRGTVIGDRIASTADPAGEFPASPRIMSPLCGPDWLACGTAGLAFDPLCGDGTAYAVREAILAAAVLGAVAKGGDATELLAHYESRLTIGFQRHLVTCREYYRSGGNGPWWAAELESLQQGLEWTAERMRHFGAFRYQLNDFELKAIA